MKLPKSNMRSRRNRYCIFKDQPIRSLKKPVDAEIGSPATKLNREDKAKSVSWKHRSILQFNTVDNKQAPQASSSMSQPGILYSDVLFSGENPKTLVTIRNLEPRQPINLQTPKIRKRIKKKDRSLKYNNECTSFNQRNSCTDPISVEKKDLEINSTFPHIVSTDLTEYAKYLVKNLSVKIPSWNFTDVETFAGFPKFTCQFDDNNYLACESVALVGLRLASDGKFKS